MTWCRWSSIDVAAGAGVHPPGTPLPNQEVRNQGDAGEDKEALHKEFVELFCFLGCQAGCALFEMC